MFSFTYAIPLKILTMDKILQEILKQNYGRARRETEGINFILLSKSVAVKLCSL